MPEIINHLEFLVGSSQDTAADSEKHVLEEWETYVKPCCSKSSLIMALYEAFRSHPAVCRYLFYRNLVN